MEITVRILGGTFQQSPYAYGDQDHSPYAYRDDIYFKCQCQMILT